MGFWVYHYNMEPPIKWDWYLFRPLHYLKLLEPMYLKTWSRIEDHAYKFVKGLNLYVSTLIN